MTHTVEQELRETHPDTNSAAQDEVTAHTRERMTSGRLDMQRHQHTNDEAEPSRQSIPIDLIAPIETLQRAISVADARVIALTSPRSGAQTRPIATLLAANIAASDTRTLLIDAAPVEAMSNNDGEPSMTGEIWQPGEPLSDHAIEEHSGARDYDRLVLQTTASTRPLFNNLQRMERALAQDLRAYRTIIIHLPPVLEPTDRAVNAVSVARAADAVFLLCALGVTRTGDAKAAADLLRQSNVRLAGTLLDNEAITRPGKEIADRLEHTRLLPRGIKHRLAAFFRHSTLFND